MCARVTMSMSRTHWKKLMNPDYIGAYALPDGQDLVVTIKSVAREVVTSAGGKKEECTVCRLVGQKPLILNATNGKTIQKLYGPFIEDWSGKQITLFASTTKLAGEVVECIRIRPVVPNQNGHAAQKKPLESARFEKAIEAIKSGTFKLEQLEKQYDLTDEQQQRINQEFYNDKNQAAFAVEDYDGREIEN